RKIMTMTYDYDYDDSDNIRITTYTDSKGDVYKNYRYYNYNYYPTFNTVASLVEMNSRGLQHLLGSEDWKMTGGDSVLIGYNLTVPMFDTGANPPLRFPATFNAIMDAPLSSTDAANNAVISKANA